MLLQNVRLYRAQKWRLWKSRTIQSVVQKGGRNRCGPRESGQAYDRLFTDMKHLILKLSVKLDDSLLPERDYIRVFFLFHIRLSFVCLSSVTFVRPTQGVETLPIFLRHFVP